MQTYAYGPAAAFQTRPIFALGEDPASNGVAATSPWWQPLALGFGNLALGVGRTFIPAVIQSELTGQPVSFVTGPAGTTVVSGQQTLQPQSTTPPWLWPAVIGGGILLFVLMRKK